MGDGVSQFNESYDDVGEEEIVKENKAQREGET